jgi:DNA-binding response OmpR family regulator
MSEGKRYRVLAAEDDPLLRDMLFDALSHEGFDACCVENGRVARERLGSTGPYDALLLDDRMPHLSGRDLLRELRTAGEDIPALILSGGCELDDDERAFLRPAAILQKPIANAEIYRPHRAAIESGRRSSS